MPEVREACSRCGTTEREVFRVPSASQLLFGGFIHRSVYRCQECENAVAKNLLAILDNPRNRHENRHSGPEDLAHASV